ncbi:MAG: aldolase/citrate lyase family protein [Pirellulales bacterium]|jgi:2-keto-3-deoxy-L-rhamnonate aldolase RhmA
MNQKQAYLPNNDKPGKRLKEKLRLGEVVYGTLIQHAVVPAIVDFIPENSIDFVIVTAEHNSLDIADFMPLRYALAAKGIACLARTHSRDVDDVAKVCDTFDGVVIPYAEDVEQLKRLAAAAVYRPLKGEALERVIREGQWPSEKTRRYVTEERCVDTLFVPMIESVRAVENLDAICGIPGVSALFIGPNDLTTNMGIPNEYDHPDFIAMVQRVIDAGAMRHIAAGSWFGKLEQQQRAIKQGSRFVVHSNDSSLLKDIMTTTFAALRKR